MNKGAERDTMNNEKRTALHLAVLNRKPDIVATLVKVSSLELNGLSQSMKFLYHRESLF